MKRMLQLLAPPIGFALLAAAVSAQNYGIDWYNVSGGGGASANGQFAISGTIGQPEAGVSMVNGQFSLTGGFWVLPQAVQTPGAPTLTIAPGTPGHAIISWTPNTPGYVLQESSSLSPANWSNSSSGAANPVTIPTLVPAKFFRLFKP